MPERNAELMLRAFEAFNSRDLDGFLAIAHEDVEIHSRIVAMEGGYHGHDGARRWWRDLLEFLPDYTIEPAGEIRAMGSATMVQLSGRGHGATSAAPLEETIWQVVRWRDGKCVWWKIFSTEAEALEAVRAN